MNDAQNQAETQPETIRLEFIEVPISRAELDKEQRAGRLKIRHAVAKLPTGDFIRVRDALELAGESDRKLKNAIVSIGRTAGGSPTRRATDTECQAALANLFRSMKFSEALCSELRRHFWEAE